MIKHYIEGWTPFYQLTPQQLGNDIDAQQHCIADLHAGLYNGNLLLTGIHCETEGVTHAWYFGQTPGDVGRLLQQNNMAPVSLSAYTGGGDVLFAVSMRRLHTPYWWYFGLTAGELGARLQQHKARPVDITAYNTPSGIRFASIMEPDKEGYWWWFGITPEDLGKRLDETGGYLRCLRTFPGNDGLRYVAVIYPNISQQTKAWYFGQTANDIKRLSCDKGIFPICIAPESNGRVSTAMLGTWPTQNSEIHKNINKQLRDAHSDGYHGFYLRCMNGPVIQAYNHEVGFDPCSTMKTLIHAHALRTIQDNSSNLDTTNISSSTEQNCPYNNENLDGLTFPININLRTALTTMMQHSNNASTEALRQHFGVNNVKQTAKTLGMKNTVYEQPIGCTNYNTATLADFGKLFERCSNGTFLNAIHWALYRDLALHHNINGLENQIKTLAQQLNLSPGLTAEYISYVECVRKGGGGGNPAEGDKRSVAGHVALPFRQKIGGMSQVAIRNYVFGVFINNTHNLEDINMDELVTQMLVDEIREGLQSMM